MLCARAYEAATGSWCALCDGSEHTACREKLVCAIRSRSGKLVWRAHTACREKLACARYTKPQRKAGVCESIRRAVRSRRVLGIRSRNGKRVCACALCEVGARARWTQRLRRHKILAVSRRVTPTNGLSFQPTGKKITFSVCVCNCRGSFPFKNATATLTRVTSQQRHCDALVSRSSHAAFDTFR